MGIKFTNCIAKIESAATHTLEILRAALHGNPRRMGSDKVSYPRLLGIIGSIPPNAHISPGRPNATTDL